MKVNSKSRDISFNGFWNSKGLKKTLGFAERNGALFTATTTLVFSAGARPLAIWAAPKTDKENKKVACAKSISSSVGEFGLTLALSLPFVRAIEKIDKNPKKYLKPETIKSLQDGAKNLKESKAYTLATQMFKLGLGLAVAAPKAILTTLGMPYVLEYVFKQPPPTPQQIELDKNNDYEFDDYVEDRLESKFKRINFKGGPTDTLAKGIGKVIDTKSMQDFATKFKDSNFPMHIVALKDAITTGVFIQQTNDSEKIEEVRKLPVMYNAFISTGLSITSSYIVDKLMEKPAERFLEKFKAANLDDPNLDKYVKGFKIAKPVLIVACIYYLAIPFISTFIAERAEKRHSLEFMHHLKKHNKH